MATREVTLDSYLKERLKDPAFKREWDKLEPQYQVTRELIRARIEGKISQRELAKKAKTTQAVLSRIENMTVSPSIGLLQRIAQALGKSLGNGPQKVMQKYQRCLPISTPNFCNFLEFKFSKSIFSV
ncbi:MAG: Toxin-antitoxin system, antitoxin component, Xre family [Candidatus Woesebacteria bacterium GW2011_GWC2_47_16]|uniref:Toxin-antitoxin system, antitoxin component, Xre family n=1 Tax=Candidatus Woesebacteria bacterium GW2011_GWC2_47_16 TaxID=1618590 RepID=A0A0G1UAW2_9BACT|nr:MAG: Toxin-antitoxin system, antitoxin component, Xre family [Candidatus Woesebacteria bacterium GW2011_GWC2_47_16]